MSAIQILIVDDHKMIRDVLKSYLEDTSKYEIVGEAAQGLEALNFLKANSVELVITDIDMPVMDGIELVENINKDFPDTKVISLTMMSDNNKIKQMLKAGVGGYLLKDAGESEIRKAIEMVMTGDNYYSAKVTNAIMLGLSKKPKKRMAQEVELSEREKEVLYHILQQETNQEIADELFISLRTVDAHKRNLIEKTGSRNLAGLVVYAMERQLFDDI